MAHWEYDSFYGEDDDDDTFQFAQALPSMASFDHALFQNDPPPYYGDYDSEMTFWAARCSASSFSQPLLIQYDPSLYDCEFNPSSTRFVVSYSVSEFGEPEFEEFNPAPYAGGYDPAQTYGKPLPASGEICHRRSQADAVLDPGSNGLAGLSKEKEESFEQEVKPSIEGENQKGKIEKEKESKKTNDEGGENGGGSVTVPPTSQIPTGYGLEAIDEEEEEESEEETDDEGENGGNREEAVNENENGKVPQISKIPTQNEEEAIDEDEESEETSDGGENGNKIAEGASQFSQIPSGYGLEAMDLCESLFGYWPCLAKMNRKREERENGCREVHGNQWSMAADYLFGSSDPYAEMGDEGRSSANPICCHGRHYQLHSYHGYAENC